MQKPDFLITGYIVNDRLLAPYRDELFKCLPSRLKNHESIDEFLRAVSAVVHNSEMSALPQNPGSQDMVASPSKGRDTALAVAKHAQRLQEALGELRRDSLMDFDGQFSGMMHDRLGSEYVALMDAVDQSGQRHLAYGDEFLDKFFSDLEKLLPDIKTLGQVANRIAENMDTGSHNQPSKAHAKNIARGVAENWLRCFGEMPKADPNDASKTTFTKFLRALATVLVSGARNRTRLSLYTEGFTIGPTVAKEAVDKLEGG